MPSSAPLFPEPTLLHGRKVYRAGDVRAYLAAVTGQPAPAPRDDDNNLLTSATVRQMLGGVSRMWEYRRLKEAERARNPSAGERAA